MTKSMAKSMTKLMTNRQAINDQTKYDHIFGRVIRDQKLATSDRQIKSGHLGRFWSFLGHLSLIMY